jgi:Coenzyme PQQ synthesis protein D (PqqD)
MGSKNIPKSRQADIAVQELENEVLIYDFRTDKAFCLNKTSALIWQACDGTKSVSEISREIGEKVNTPVGENLVWLAIDQLIEDDLMDDSQPVVSKFQGLSRREVIKKVGLTSMVALPVISSLVAPTAAMGASTCGVPCTCTNNTVNMGEVCGTCATAGCTVCRKRNSGNGNSAGDCFTS